jgi:hypothetical protein
VKGEYNVAQVIAFIVLFLVSAYLNMKWDAAAEARTKEEEEKRGKEVFAKALTQTGVANVVAYGHLDGPSEAMPADLEADLIRREKAKWDALNAGRLLTMALLGCGTVTTRFSTDGMPHLDVVPGQGQWVDFRLIRESGPYIPKNFQMTQPNPDTAVLRYEIENIWPVGKATAVWARRDRRWVTVSYSVTRA